MKTSKAFKFFLMTAIVSALISIITYFYKRDAILDFTIFDLNIHSAYATIWEVFCLYLFVLAIVYYIIDNSSLRPRKWLVTSHVVFIILFLIAFVGFSIFDTSGFRVFISIYRVPAVSIFSIYAFLLVLDITLFLGGLLLLGLNLLSLHKEKQR